MVVRYAGGYAAERAFRDVFARPRFGASRENVSAVFAFPPVLIPEQRQTIFCRGYVEQRLDVSIAPDRL